MRRFSSLVIEIRRGEAEKLMMIPQILGDNEHMILNNSIDHLTNYLADLDENLHGLDRFTNYQTNLDENLDGLDDFTNYSANLDENLHGLDRFTNYRTNLDENLDGLDDFTNYSANLDENLHGLDYLNRQHVVYLDGPGHDAYLMRHRPTLTIEMIENTLRNMNNSEESQTPTSDLMEGLNENFRSHLAVNDPPSSPLSTTAYASTLPYANVQVSTTDEFINILLLGETGVGKSTFINAFAYYLTFSTFQQAEKSKPVVLIPVSFPITAGDNFEEHTVKFGDVGGLTNEDFSHPGQSVTKLCQSYEFNLQDSIGRKLRIIDTPGFADTRDVVQDDRNIQHILGYSKHLSHIDFVCFFLKPNEARLNITYKLCLTQLVPWLDSNIDQNIIFCFTNARSTLYTPGNTAPLLQTMLNSLPMRNIPFHKDNTFCFDSESFRYLVALQNGILFNESEKQKYEMSWKNSVEEARCLINYIVQKFIAR
jgi:hypothetical protein